MNVYLLRHGRTAWTEQHRYQGRRDSPLSRARRTAELLFPGAEQRVEPDLVEMDFGAFEGRSYRDMEDDPAYRAWVDGGCWGRCPGGEDRPGFCLRARTAVERLADRALAEGREELVIVAHGGVLMAAMEGLALPEKDYFDWQTAPGTGYLLTLEPALWRESRRLRLLSPLSYRQET